MIGRFEGDYGFLSNFWPSPVRYPPDGPAGPVYPTVEHAFQAIKTDVPVERALILAARSAAQAKRLGRRVTMRADWAERRVDVMRDLLREKFRRDPLRSLLLATGEEPLVEGNAWHDQLWGQCVCPRHAGEPGQNLLGRLLMEVRAELG